MESYLDDRDEHHEKGCIMSVNDHFARRSRSAEAGAGFASVANSKPLDELVTNVKVLDVRDDEKSQQLGDESEEEDETIERRSFVVPRRSDSQLTDTTTVALADHDSTGRSISDDAYIVDERRRFLPEQVLMNRRKKEGNNTPSAVPHISSPKRPRSALSGCRHDKSLRKVTKEVWLSMQDDDVQKEVLQELKIPNRVGSWTQEEEAYAAQIADLFRCGHLPNCPNGATMRALLANLLNCTPMRISKKYSGLVAVGKRGYRHAPEPYDKIEVDHHLSVLETAFHHSVKESDGKVPLKLSLLRTSGLRVPSDSIQWSNSPPKKSKTSKNPSTDTNILVPPPPPPTPGPQTIAPPSPSTMYTQMMSGVIPPPLPIPASRSFPGAAPQNQLMFPPPSSVNETRKPLSCAPAALTKDDEIDHEIAALNFSSPPQHHQEYDENERIKKQHFPIPPLPVPHPAMMPRFPPFPFMPTAMMLPYPPPPPHLIPPPVETTRGEPINSNFEQQQQPTPSPSTDNTVRHVSDYFYNSNFDNSFDDDDAVHSHIYHDQQSSFPSSPRMDSTHTFPDVYNVSNLVSGESYDDAFLASV